MPLVKSQTAIVAATPPATPAAYVAPAAEAPKKRSLKPKASVTPAAAPAVDAAVESAVNTAGQAAAESVGSLQPKTLDEKSKQIQKQGLWQAVVQSNALVQYAPSLDIFLDLVDKAADRGLVYVNSSR